MNVIIDNERQNELANLEDVDVIKNLSGVYGASQIVEMFKSFFYNKMILDVTAMEDYQEVSSYKELVSGLDPNKIIFLLPSGSSLCTPNFLGHLISLGIYNFTTNLKGVKFLLRKSNTLEDVEHIKKMGQSFNDEDEKEDNYSSSFTDVSTKVENGVTILGFRNITNHAGATTFIYILKKELCSIYGADSVVAIEIGRNDFKYLIKKDNDNFISIQEDEIQSTLADISDTKFVLVDLNECQDDSFCSDVIYLLEPTTLQLNKLVKKDSSIFQKMSDYKVVLNKSLLLNNDVSDFQTEAGLKFFYNIPPLDERKRNAVVNDFLSKLGLVGVKKSSGESGRIFGLFRR